MLLTEALCTSRPVLFESGIEPFLYYGGGSALLCRLNTHVYVVTVKHVVADRLSSDLRIFLDDASPYFIVCGTPFSPTHNDESWQDICVFPAGVATGAPMPIPALDLGTGVLRRGADALIPSRRLFISGYPNSHREIDWDAGRAQVTRVLVDALYHAPDQDRSHIHRIRIPEYQRLRHPDGMSGAPVFASCSTEIGLVGILIEAPTIRPWPT